MYHFYTIPRDWADETAFVLCGGTSVTDEHCEALRGRKVIAVNSMYRKAMWAPMLFFADMWWYVTEKRTNLETWRAFKGLKLTKQTITDEPNIGMLFWESAKSGLSKRPDGVAIGHSSAQAAVNIAVHKGATRIVLLGVDNCRAANGRAHCHEEYPGNRCQESGWQKKEIDLGYMVKPLEELGIEVLNASPISALPFWPKIELKDVL